VVDQFTAEAKLIEIKDIADLNAWWMDFLNEYYEKKPHDGIREYYQSQGIAVPPEGISPEQEWNRDSRQLNYYDAARVSEAFLHYEKRVVDKGAQISFRGMKYEASSALIGAKVTISYDPLNPEEITIHYKGTQPFKAKPVGIGPYCKPETAVPDGVEKSNKAATSRLLEVARKKAERSGRIVADAISFGAFNESEKQ
jgi:hypothetical protein